ncbi:hypothetical protein KFE19_12785 [Dysosmobacter sp. Marseille-Q4140]|nr:hypothetical protein KFE19_12785 [Dysosmobacter sp. Marseille-Q4140]
MDKEDGKSFTEFCRHFSAALLHIPQKSGMLKQGGTPPGFAGRHRLRKKE